jgi:hypothetical protein
MQEFEEVFPGESFLMQFSAKGPTADEIDLQPVYRSIDQKIEWTKQIERNYRRILPSMNFFAQSSQTHVFDTVSHLASERIAIRCCRGTNAELAKSLEDLGQAKTIVVDASALATLFLSRSYRFLKDIPLQLVVSFGAYRSLRQLYIERLNSTGQGFLTKVGDRFVFQEENVEARQKYLDDFGEFIQLLESLALIEEGRAFAKIPREEREKIDHLFGRASGESIALAQADDRILWLDDLPLAQHAGATFGVRCAWTQSVLCHGYERTWLSEDVFATVSLELIQFGYTVTRLVPNIVCAAGKRANWSLSDRHFRTALSWFGNGDVPAARVAWAAANVIVDVMTIVVDPTQSDEIVAALLHEVSSRHDGQSLLKKFREDLDASWKTVAVDAERLKCVIDHAIK